MQRTLVNLLVDVAIAFIMLGMLLTGYVIKFALPPGTNKAWMLWELTRHQWGEIHFWIGAILLVLIVVHVCLHWNWIVTVVRQRLGLPKTSKNGALPSGWLAVVTVAASLGGFAWMAHLGVAPVPETHSETCREDVMPSPKQATPESTIQAHSTLDPSLTWKDIYPIFERSCLPCHGPQKQRANFRVDQVDKLLSAGDKTSWIVPGRSEASPLIEIVTGRREIALPTRHRLPDADVAQLRKWIDSGAAVVAPGR